MDSLIPIVELDPRKPDLEATDGQLEVELTALDWQVYRLVPVD